MYAAAGLSGRSHVDDRLLTLVFAFGTAHAWCAVLGQVWFTGLIVGVTCGLLFLLAVETGRPWSAGLALAAAMATRPHLALLGLYLPLRRGGRPGILLRASLPPLIAAVGLALYNHARFERVAEFGHTYLAAGGLEHIARHGLFNGAYLARNLTAALALLPTLHADPPYLTLSRHGMALWWSTPVLLWAVPSLRGTPSSARRALAWTALAVALPPLLYQNTGWVQFGYRFALDWMALAIALVALSGRSLERGFRLAAAWSVAIALFGAAVFKRFPVLFDDHLPL